MVVGFNHNVMYRGEMFHVQTEDSGVNNPHIITLLYRGGTILSSKKTSYADILKIENLEQVVEELMKEQHKDILRRLKSGEFDARAFPNAAPAAPLRQPIQAAPAPAQAQAPVSPKPAAPAQAPLPPVQAAAPASAPPAPASSPATTPSSSPEGAKPAQSLDEIILNYLVAGDD
jgi:hypothetical protein